jgi:hypothetical protein
MTCYYDALQLVENHMPNTAQPQSPQNIFTKQANRTKNKLTTRDLRQDKYAPERVRAGSRQPVRTHIIARTQRADTKQTRSKKRSTNRQTEQIAAWVPKPIKAEIQRLMEQNGWSQSYAVKTLVEAGLAHSLGQQHAVMLKATIEEQIRKEMRSFRTLLTWLLTRVAFDAAQSRILTKNILSRQPGLTPKRRDEILDECVRRAKSNITRETPQLTEIVEAVERWMYKDGKEKA